MKFILILILILVLVLFIRKKYASNLEVQRQR